MPGRASTAVLLSANCASKSQKVALSISETNRFYFLIQRQISACMERGLLGLLPRATAVSLHQSVSEEEATPCLAEGQLFARYDYGMMGQKGHANPDRNDISEVADYQGVL